MYFPDEPDPQRDFRHFLNLKFRQSCNPWELTCFGIAAGVIAFMVQYFPVHEAGVTPAAADISKLPASYWIVLSGFFGAFSGALVLILKKHRTLDIYPTTYFQASIALILGPLVGGFLSTKYMTATAVGGLITATSFGLGFITATNVNFLGSLLRRQVAAATGVSLPQPTQGDLDTLIYNSEAVESLNNMSCFSVAEFVSMEPVILYLSMPQPINCLDEWLDQGLLVHYFRPHLNELERVDIKRFTQLMEYVVANFPVRQTPQATIAAIAWRQGAFQITGNTTADRIIARATQAIGNSEIHHRLFGNSIPQIPACVLLGTEAGKKPQRAYIRSKCVFCRSSNRSISALSRKTSRKSIDPENGGSDYRLCRCVAKNLYQMPFVPGVRIEASNAPARTRVRSYATERLGESLMVDAPGFEPGTPCM